MTEFDSLSGKNILVVGGAGLLGKEFCNEISKSGAMVIAVDINKLALKKLNLIQKNIICLHIDVTKEKSIKASKKIIQEKVGKLDGIVISSGIDAKFSPQIQKNFLPFEKFSLRQWESEIETGLTGIFLLLKHFSDILNSSSSVVIISSDLSVISPDQRVYNLGFPELVNFKPLSYSTIKSGITGIVRYLSTYWAPRNIRINSISPGGVQQDQPENFRKALEERIPLGRLARKNEYNKVVRFLLSEGSSYLTGQNIVIDGGRSVW